MTNVVLTGFLAPGGGSLGLPVNRNRIRPPTKKGGDERMNIKWLNSKRLPMAI